MNEEIISRIALRTDKQLMDDIAQGPSVFREGIYDLYLKEAQKRYLNVTIDKTIENNISLEQEEMDKKARQLIFIGSILTVFSLAIFAFIPGLELLKKDKDKKYYFDRKHHLAGKTFILASSIIWTIIIVVVIYSIFFVYNH